MNALRKTWRRWLFRRLFPNYKIHNVTARPNDGQEVLVLDASNRGESVWIAQYDANYSSYSAGHGGWFEHDEIDYWVPMIPVDND